MQLRLPKPKGQDKRRKRPPIVSTSDAPPCGICEKQISRYTCPSCNLPYCSLVCFRSPQHAACQDRFQRATLAEDLRADQPASVGEKNRMLEMLWKFEDQQRELEELERQEGLDDDEDEEDDDAELSAEALARRKERQALEKRLEGIDLDAVPPEQLLAYLSPEQQAAFEATLLDPKRLNRLVEEQLEGDEPWWIEEEELRMLKEMRTTSRRAVQEAGGGVDEEEDLDEDEDEDENLQVRPPLLAQEQLPPLKIGPDGKPLVNPQLLHNIAAVLFAYAFTLRTFSLTSFASLPPPSSERTTAIQVIATLLPFLVERSTAAFDGLESAVESVVEQEEEGMRSPLIALLLHDVATLLRPKTVVALSPSSSPLASHALSAALHALSDLHHLFSVALSQAASSALRAPPHATHQTGGAGPTVTKPLIVRPSTAVPLSKAERTQCALGKTKTLFYAAVLATPVGAGAGVVEACKELSQEAEQLAQAKEAEEEERQGRVDKTRQELEQRGSARREAERTSRKEEPEGAAPGASDTTGPEQAAGARGPRIVEL